MLFRDLTSLRLPYGFPNYIDLSKPANIVLLGEGDDSIEGGCGNDLIFGEAGNDKIYGNTWGLDTLCTFDSQGKQLSENAQKYYGSDRDVIFGGFGGFNEIEGGPDADVIYGSILSNGFETVYGDNKVDDARQTKPTDGNDIICGGSGGADYIIGGGGDDQIISGPSEGSANDANDVRNMFRKKLWGGDGKETFTINGKKADDGTCVDGQYDENNPESLRDSTPDATDYDKIICAESWGQRYVDYAFWRRQARDTDIVEGNVYDVANILLPDCKEGPKQNIPISPREPSDDGQRVTPPSQPQQGTGCCKITCEEVTQDAFAIPNLQEHREEGKDRNWCSCQNPEVRQVCNGGGPLQLPNPEGPKPGVAISRCKAAGWKPGAC